MGSYTCPDRTGSAQAAKLRYVNDATPGIARRPVGSAFGYFLPDGKRIRNRETLARIEALAIPPAWLEMTRMRVGNEEYARENDSFGLTTLRTRQVRLEGATLQFRFRGKSGVWHAFAVSDRRLASIVRRMRDLPRYDLFQYVHEHGKLRAVDSTDVNAYLKRVAGEEFTSKDFRTWAGTVLAAEALHQFGKNGVSQAIERVARQLGNTKAVCRKCYIHPALVQAHLDGGPARAMTGRSAEACVKRLLDRRSKPRSVVPLLTKSLRRLRRRGTQLASTATQPFA